MPRKGKGGMRQGTVGTAYSNRTDLNQPISTVPGQEYGKAAAQAEAQSSIPMAASPVASAPAAPAPTMSSSMRQPAQPMPQPGSMPLFEPSNSGQPVTSGMPFGPGSNVMNQPTTSRTPFTDSMRGIAPGSAPMSAIVKAAAMLGL